jgi:hypothetical protein
MATSMPRSWLSILFATDSPAASSAAELIRRPDESRSIAVSILSPALSAYVLDVSAATFVLITVIDLILCS